MSGASYFTGGAIAAAVALALLAWALFVDRSRGRRRCPKCWYDMSAAVERRCPECGRRAKHDRKLLKTRRRWKLSLASLVPFALGAYLALQPKVQQDGWWSVMPTTVMLLYLNIAQDDAVIEAIDRRISLTHQDMSGGEFRVPQKDLMYEWQWRWLTRIVIDLLSEDDPPFARCDRYLDWAVAMREMFEGDDVYPRIIGAIEHQMTHQDAWVRVRAAMSCVDPTDPEGTVARLTPLLDDDEPRVMGAAVTALNMLLHYTHGDVAFAALIDAIEHSNPEVAGWAAFHMGSYVRYDGGDALRVMTALRNAMERTAGATGEFRTLMIAAYADLADDDERPTIIADALASDDPHARAGALQILFIRGLDRTISLSLDAVIAELMRADATQMGRNTAGWLLERCTEQDLLRPHEAALRELALHPHLITSRAARTALERLGIDIDPPEHEDGPAAADDDLGGAP